MSELMSATELYEILRPYIDFPSRLSAFTIDAKLGAPVKMTCECWVEYSGDPSIVEKVTSYYHIVKDDENILIKE